jgi:hypothetical protein
MEPLPLARALEERTFYFISVLLLDIDLESKLLLLVSYELVSAFKRGLFSLERDMNHLDRNSLSRFAAVSTSEYKRFAPIDSVMQIIHILIIVPSLPCSDIDNNFVQAQSARYLRVE